MATANDTTNDGPGLALAVLYEANDLLNVLREHDTNTAANLSAPYWTLISEVSRRLNSAIAALNGAVPHPADAREAAKPANDDGAPRPGYDLLIDIQIQVGELQGVAELAGEVCGEKADQVLSTIARRLEALVDQMNWLIPFVEGKADTGATSLAETRRRLEAECATMSAEECSQRLAAHLLYASRNLAADIGDDFTVTESCTLKGLRTLVARQELLQSALPDYEPTELYRRAVNGAA